MSIRKSLLAAGFVAVAAVIPAGAQQANMTFFVTSIGLGKGADLGGLAGADAHCQKLAASVGATAKTWHAYLSTQGANAVNARDRIGKGPWTNAKGLVVATSVEDLHSANNKLNKQNSLSEKGDIIKGSGDKPNRHDALTGTQADGTAFPADKDMTCKNWTSSTQGISHARAYRPRPLRRRPERTLVERVASFARPARRSAPVKAAARRLCKAPAATGCFTASRSTEAHHKRFTDGRPCAGHVCFD